MGRKDSGWLLDRKQINARGYDRKETYRRLHICKKTLKLLKLILIIVENYV